MKLDYCSSLQLHSTIWISIKKKHQAKHRIALVNSFRVAVRAIKGKCNILRDKMNLRTDGHHNYHIPPAKTGIKNIYFVRKESDFFCGCPSFVNGYICCLLLNIQSLMYCHNEYTSLYQYMIFSTPYTNVWKTNVALNKRREWL